MIKSTSQQGYTLLFAVIITSIILAVSISILSISQKEIILSSASRDSQASLYAADSAIECVLYWKDKGKMSTTSGAQTINCNNQDLVIDYTVGPVYAVSDLVFSLEDELGGETNGPCATIAITQQYQGTAQVATADARGYNTCNELNPRRTERGIRLSF